LIVLEQEHGFNRKRHVAPGMFCAVELTIKNIMALLRQERGEY
jgi:hypothetical protein